MKQRKFFRSMLAWLMVVALFAGILPATFAAEDPGRQQVTVEASDLVDKDEAAMVDALCEQYGLSTAESEDREFGTLENIDPNAKGATKADAVSTKYVFLDFEPGSSSRNFNWQVKTDSSKELYHGPNITGTVVAYYQGSDSRLYMPVELGDSYINGRLKQYALKTGDIAQVRIQSITANDTFVSGGTGTVQSYFGVHTDTTAKDPGTWQSFGSNQKLKQATGAQILTWNVYSNLIGQTIRGVRWDPSQSEIPETRIFVDYIYVGPAVYAPVRVEYRNETNTSILNYRYNGYGKTAPPYNTGKVNSETATTRTIWGWAVHQDTNKDGIYEDMERFVTDPSTVTVNYDTRFVLTKLTVPKVESTQDELHAYTGVSETDDGYVLTAAANAVNDLSVGSYGTPLDVAIVLDRSGSMGDLVTKKNFGANASTNTSTPVTLTEYMETLSKCVQPGYYRATAFRKNKHNGSDSGISGYLYTMPVRYYRGSWQMQYLVNCTCNGGYYSQYGIYPWNSTGLKSCSHVKWISIMNAYDQFVADAEATGYIIGKKYTMNGYSETLYFSVGASYIGREQLAVRGFMEKLYKSGAELEPGQNHTVSVVSFGSTVFMDGYPYNDSNSGYKTANNYSASRVSTELSYNTYESIMKCVNDPYVYGASRVDCAFQVLTGEVSAIERSAGKTKATANATDYLPAVQNGRKRVVILLTDGVPSSYLEFDTRVANDAVKASFNLKSDSSTKVFCVGIMKGLDASVTKIYNDTSSPEKMANDFLNAMSSRYKGANVWNTGGTLTSGPYYVSDYSDAASSTWSYMYTGDTPATIPVLNSKYLFLEPTGEWKIKTDEPIRVYGAPYVGNGQYGEPVLLGEHAYVPSMEDRIISSDGYDIHFIYDDLYDTTGVCLDWNDPSGAFIRETPVSLGAEARPMVTGTAFDTSRGYKIYLEVPVELDRERTWGGNNIPLLRETSGCYDDLPGSGTEDLLAAYDIPNANAAPSLIMDCNSYDISVEDYEALMNGEMENGLRFVMENMVRMPEVKEIYDQYGDSLIDHLGFEIKITAEDGTLLYHREAVCGEEAWSENYDNLYDGIVDLSVDQSFVVYMHLYFVDYEVDSFGRAPYENIEFSTQVFYCVPKNEDLPPVEPTEPTEPTEPEEPAEPEVVQALKPGHSLNLESSISINYVVSAATLAQYDSYEIKCYIGDRLSQPVPVEKDGYIYFVLTDVNALNMSTMIRAEIYAYKDGKVYVSPLDEYSVATYVTNMLSKNIPDAFRKVCVNLLRYGAASQTYKGFNTESLADACLTEEQKSWITDLETVAFGNNNTVSEDMTDDTVKFIGKTLVLDSTVCIKLVVDASAFAGTEEDLELRATFINVKGEEEEIRSKATVYNATKKQYMFVIDQLNASELREVLSCRVYAGDRAVSRTLLYSADTYGNGKAGALLDLCKALFAYADAAKAFFAS